MGSIRLAWKLMQIAFFTAILVFSMSPVSLAQEQTGKITTEPMTYYLKADDYTLPADGVSSTMLRFCLLDPGGYPTFYFSCSNDDCISLGRYGDIDIISTVQENTEVLARYTAPKIEPTAQLSDIVVPVAIELEYVSPEGYFPTKTMRIWMNLEIGEYVPPSETPSETSSYADPIKGIGGVTISNIVGDVEVKRADEDEWEEAVEGMWLGKDDYISTGYESQVTVHFGTVSKVVVREMTQLRIALFFLSDKVATTELQLRIGAVNVVVDKKIVQETTFKVTTPTAVMSVRGTKFQVIVSPENVITCKVVEGSVSVIPNIHPEKEIIVNAGQRVTVTESSIYPVEYLTGDELAALNKEFEAMSGVITDFNDGKAQNWKTRGSGCWVVTDGVLVMTGNKEYERAMRCAYYDQEFCDFTYQVDMRKIAGDSSGWVEPYGIIMRLDETFGNCYQFFITVEGRYMIAKRVGGAQGEPTYLIEESTSDALKTGYNQWNTLKVVAQGSTLKFYANNKLLRTIQDTSHSCGNVGIFAHDSWHSDTPDTVQFDNVLIAKTGEPTPTPTQPPKSTEAYLEIIDDTCAGYDVYVDDVYQFNEGDDGTPDGYCSFYLAPGTHTIELWIEGLLKLHGLTSPAFLTSNFEGGQSYKWDTMPDYWCDSSIGSISHDEG